MVEKKGMEEKCLLRDQPCVRLASGDINTSDAAGATILPFTAGEGDKRPPHKRSEERMRGLARLHSTPSGQQPRSQVQHSPDESKNKESDVHFL